MNGSANPDAPIEETMLRNAIMSTLTAELGVRRAARTIGTAIFFIPINVLIVVITGKARRKENVFDNNNNNEKSRLDNNSKIILLMKVTTITTSFHK